MSVLQVDRRVLLLGRLCVEKVRLRMRFAAWPILIGRVGRCLSVIGYSRHLLEARPLPPARREKCTE